MISPRLKILYDGECPMCRREMEWLKRRDKNGRLELEDIAAPGFDPRPYGCTREQVSAGIHAILPDGAVISRMEVFRQAYRAVGLGWLIAPTGWPGLRWVFDRLYDLFARNRMKIGRLLGRSCDSGSCRS